MKHKFKKTVSLFLMMVAISCNYEKTNIKSNFKSEKNIRHTVMELANGEFLSRVFDMALTGNDLIVHDDNAEHFFSIININNNSLYARFGKLGQGPNELLMMPTQLTVLNDSIMTLFNSNQNTLFYINYKGDLLPKKKLEFIRSDNIKAVIPISSQRYIALGAFEEGRYLLLDENGEKLSFNFDYPSLSDGTGISTPLFKFMAFQGALMRKPNGESFFFACSSSEIFEIIEVDEDDEMEKIFSYHGETGQFVFEGDGYKGAAIAHKKVSKVFFINATCSDNYIYLLYSNKVIGDNLFGAYRSNNVLVFDWKGKPVTSLVLDIEVDYIAVDEKDSYMYAYSRSTEQLVKFDLPQ